MENFVVENVPTAPLRRGWGNGYIIIPRGNILFGKNCNEIHKIMPELKVHGGLTFSDYSKNLDSSFLPKGTKDSWIIGFDTNHYSDDLKKWSEEKVKKETKFLAYQIEQFTKKHTPKTKITFNIDSVKLIESNGTDLVVIKIKDNNKAFPTMKYDSLIKIECEKGIGESYCKNVLDVEPEIVKN